MKVQSKISAHEQFSWLESALEPLSRFRVAVLGDFCLDAYWHLDPGEQEISVETGLPVRRVRSQRYSLGGAGNVVANLVDLGVGNVQAIGVVGPDFFGEELLRLLRKRGVDVDSSIIIDNSWQTMVYAKPMRGAYEESRLDFGGFNLVSAQTANALIAALEKAAPQCSAIVVNQQVTAGVCNSSLIQRINNVIASNPKTQFVVDARHQPGLYKGAVLKLNVQEAARFLGESVASDSTLIAVEKVKEFAFRITRATGKPAFVTRGEHGIVLADGETVQVIPGIQVLEKTDPVGAGDTVVAALAAVLGSGQSPETAARLANIAAMITVRKLGVTGTATLQEIRTIGPQPDYVFEPELAEMPHRAQFLQGTEIELIGTMPEVLRIQHCIFDHDGTLSTLREGWEGIMEPMMVRAILGSHYETADLAALTQITKDVREYIDRTTGVQTLVQMRGLVDLVRQYGFVGEDQILDEHGYKRIFNHDLLKMVGTRMNKLRSGELDPNDFQIKNASALLRELHRRGIRLYLASGTDEADVISEAQAMGYAGLFEGRIFGAVGDIKVEAKKLVLERIIRENNLEGSQFATFGDGPVEMRETRKRGGFCIGIASDELRRFGLNTVKRARLIRAGANLVIPDFSQLSTLLQVLQFA